MSTIVLARCNSLNDMQLKDAKRSFLSRKRVEEKKKTTFSPVFEKELGEKNIFAR